MRKTLTDLGLAGTELVIRDADDNTQEQRRITGDELRKLIEVLAKLEEDVIDTQLVARVLRDDRERTFALRPRELTH